MPHVDLDDCGTYVRWLLDHRDRANGTDLEVAIDMVDYHDLAKAFTAVTGKPARYIPTSLEEYWATGPMSYRAESASGVNSSLEDPASLTVKKNFTGFWNVFAASAGNNGVITRNFELLNDIAPNRTKSVEEWFRTEEKRGLEAGEGSLWERVQNLKPILKIHEDFGSKSY